MDISKIHMIEASAFPGDGGDCSGNNVVAQCENECSTIGSE